MEIAADFGVSTLPETAIRSITDPVILLRGRPLDTRQRLEASGVGSLLVALLLGWLPSSVVICLLDTLWNKLHDPPLTATGNGQGC